MSFGSISSSIGTSAATQAQLQATAAQIALSILSAEQADPQGTQGIMSQEKQAVSSTLNSIFQATGIDLTSTVAAFEQNPQQAEQLLQTYGQSGTSSSTNSSAGSGITQNDIVAATWALQDLSAQQADAANPGQGILANEQAQEAQYLSGYAQQYGADPSALQQEIAYFDQNPTTAQQVLAYAQQQQGSSLGGAINNPNYLASLFTTPAASTNTSGGSGITENDIVAATWALQDLSAQQADAANPGQGIFASEQAQASQYISGYAQQYGADPNSLQQERAYFDQNPATAQQILAYAQQHGGSVSGGSSAGGGFNLQQLLSGGQINTGDPLADTLSSLESQGPGALLNGLTNVGANLGNMVGQTVMSNPQLLSSLNLGANGSSLLQSALSGSESGAMQFTLATTNGLVNNIFGNNNISSLLQQAQLEAQGVLPQGQVSGAGYNNSYYSTPSSFSTAT